jgi:hypothetical protein
MQPVIPDITSGASIASGAGTNSITVNFSGAATSGSISVYGLNSCGNGTSSVMTVAGRQHLLLR